MSPSSVSTSDPSTKRTKLSRDAGSSLDPGTIFPPRDPIKGESIGSLHGAVESTIGRALAGYEKVSTVISGGDERVHVEAARVAEPRAIEPRALAPQQAADEQRPAPLQIGTSARGQGSNAAPVLKWRSGITQSLIEKYWQRHQLKIMDLVREKSPVKSRENQISMQRQTGRMWERVNKRVKEEKQAFLRTKDGELDQANQRAREGLWDRFQENWRRDRIAKEELATLRPLHPDVTIKHFKPLFRKRVRAFMDRLDANPEGLIFPRPATDKNIMFLGVIRGHRINSPQTMLDVTAARTVEEYALRMYPHTCSQRGFKKARHFVMLDPPQEFCKLKPVPECKR